MSNVVKLAFLRDPRPKQFPVHKTNPEVAIAGPGQATPKRRRGRPKLHLLPTSCESDFEEVAEAVKSISNQLWPAAKENVQLAVRGRQLPQSARDLLTTILAGINRRTGFDPRSIAEYTAATGHPKRTVQFALRRLEQTGVALRSVSPVHGIRGLGRQLRVTLPALVEGAELAEIVRNERCGSRHLDQWSGKENARVTKNKSQNGAKKMLNTLSGGIENACEYTDFTGNTDDLIRSEESHQPLQRISAAALEQARQLAPGWDVEYLVSEYLNWEGSRKARNIDAAFVGWVRKTYAGRLPGNAPRHPNQKSHQPTCEAGGGTRAPGVPQRLECNDPRLVDKVDAFQSELRKLFAPDVVEGWFRQLRIERMRDQILILSLPDKFLVHWVEKNYLGQLSRAAQTGFGVDCINLVVANEQHGAIRSSPGGNQNLKSTP